MIHLEHINLVVKDLNKSLAFYQIAFPHWHIRGGGESDWYGHPRQWLHFGDDYQYISLNDNGSGKNRDLKGHDLGLAHFAFVTSDIKGLIKRMDDFGFKQNVAYSYDNQRASVYYLDPDGFELEFVQYFSDQPKLRNIYK